LTNTVLSHTLIGVMKCKLCDVCAPNLHELKRHWRIKHMANYINIMAWLRDTDAKIVEAECIIEQEKKGEET
jgi:hypothetical protein